MKMVTYAFIGIVLGSVIVWCSAWGLGMLLPSLGIATYSSEFDQQRNFNIFVIAWVLVAAFAGWIGFRRAAR